MLKQLNYCEKACKIIPLMFHNGSFMNKIFVRILIIIFSLTLNFTSTKTGASEISNPRAVFTLVKPFVEFFHEVREKLPASQSLEQAKQIIEAEKDKKSFGNIYTVLMYGSKKPIELSQSDFEFACAIRDIIFDLESASNTDEINKQLDNLGKKIDKLERKK